MEIDIFRKTTKQYFRISFTNKSDTNTIWTYICQNGENLKNHIEHHVVDYWKGYAVDVMTFLETDLLNNINKTKKNYVELNYKNLLKWKDYCSIYCIKLQNCIGVFLAFKFKI